MSVASAEMTKHALNGFLATSVVFANEIATLCEFEGANAEDVAKALKTDKRVGPNAYLAPGGPFFGSTLARDIHFLRSVFNRHAVKSELITAIKKSNDNHKDWVKRKFHENFGSINGLKVSIWGLVYKPGTDTLRGSPSVSLCEWLIEHGAIVCVHDPVVRKLPKSLCAKVDLKTEAIDTISDADALVIATCWPEYQSFSRHSILDSSASLVVFDINGHLRNTFLPGDQYIAVGSNLRGTPYDGVK